VTTFLQVSDRAEPTKTMHVAHARAWIIPVLGDARLDQLNVNDVHQLMLTMNADAKSEALAATVTPPCGSPWTTRCSTG
jgi:hypothetical protein